MVVQVDGHLVDSASLNLIQDCLLTGWLWWNYHVTQNMSFIALAAMLPEQRITSHSSQHGDEGWCSLSLCCKFEINLRLFAIWLVAVKFASISTMKLWVQLFYCPSQVAYNLEIILNLQYRLSEHPTVSPCCEELLASLLSDGRAART